MGIFGKIRSNLNPNEDMYDDEYTNQISRDGMSYDDEQQGYYQDDAGAMGSQNTSNMAVSGANLELKVVKPKTYGEDAKPIGRHLKEGRTVVLNLEIIDKDDVSKILSFLSGVIFTINGTIKKVAPNTYVLTPYGVSVSNDDLSKKQAAPNPQPAAPAYNEGYETNF